MTKKNDNNSGLDVYLAVCINETGTVVFDGRFQHGVQGRALVDIDKKPKQHSLSLTDALILNRQKEQTGIEYVLKSEFTPPKEEQVYTREEMSDKDQEIADLKAQIAGGEEKPKPSKKKAGGEEKPKPE